MSLHYLVKYECRKWHHSEIRIAINDESQDSIAKNLRCAKLLYYIFIIHSAGERIFKIGEDLPKLRAKSLTVSYTPFALHFCPQRCRSRQISWITCVLQTETVINRGCVVRQKRKEKKRSNCCRPVLTYWLTDWCRQWLTDCWSCTAFAVTAFLCCCSCVQWVMGFLYDRCKQLFVSELNNAYFSRHLF